MAANVIVVWLCDRCGAQATSTAAIIFVPGDGLRLDARPPAGWEMRAAAETSSATYCPCEKKRRAGLPHSHE
jgi:hypothetical protein